MSQLERPLTIAVVEGTTTLGQELRRMLETSSLSIAELNLFESPDGLARAAEHDSQDDVDLTPDSASSTDLNDEQALTNKRTSSFDVAPIKGVAVTAVNAGDAALESGTSVVTTTSVRRRGRLRRKWQRKLPRKLARKSPMVG